MSSSVVVALPGMLCTERLWTQPGFDLGPDVQLHPVRLQGSTIDEMVCTILQLHHPRFSVVGLSLGGIVALRLAEAAPDRVDRVAVLSATARPPRAAQHDSWDTMAARTAAGGFAGVTHDLLPSLVGPTYQDELRGAVTAMADDVGPRRFLDQLAAQHSRTDLRPSLATIACPVLVCAGQHDALAPTDAQQEIAQSVPHGVFHVVADAGHLSSLEQPVEVSRVLRAWATV